MPRPSPSTGAAVFVGSFNFDPRSAKLNTEMGLVIDSASLAERLSTMLDNASPALAYRVTLDANGSLRLARRPRRDAGRRARDRLGPADEGPDLLLAADRVAALTAGPRS